MNNRKDLRAYLAQLRKRGYQVSRGGDHWQIRCGGRLVATCGTTPSSNRTLAYVRTAVRRYERGQAS
jgi:hypothetical protein